MYYMCIFQRALSRGIGHLFFYACNFLASLLDYNSVSLKNSFIQDIFFIKLVLVNINHGKKLLNYFERVSNHGGFSQH
jgi:hypothetical protein